MLKLSSIVITLFFFFLSACNNANPDGQAFSHMTPGSIDLIDTSADDSEPDSPDIKEGEEDSENSNDFDAQDPLALKRSTSSFSSAMTTSSGFALDNYAPGGSILFGSSEPTASDGLVARMTYPGDPDLTFADQLSPEYAQQIRTTKAYGYGQYNVVTKMAPCATTSEGLVHGFFTYWNNGTDQNANGMIDNSEIDIEILCSDPSRIYMTIWTDYTDEYHFSKVTRSINMKTGAYQQTKAGQEANRWDLNASGYLKNATGAIISLPAFKADNGDWIEFGFLWRAGQVSYTMKWQGTTYPLWTYSTASHIPTHEAPFMVNMWHQEADWTTDMIVDYPTADVETLVDSFSYKP